MKPEAQAPEVEVLLPPTEDAVPSALAALDGLGDRLGPEELQDARLLVSELVSNAVRHAGLGPEDELRLSVAASPEVVRGEVLDPGTKGFEPPRP
ncbi:MAG: ATP-binding protein, partial [Actinomycetota bacterium]|nr:ATP-binding protein [Actinomycetota bacterium]